MSKVISLSLNCKAELGGFMPSYWLANTQHNSDRTPTEIRIRVREGWDD
jgi:hypothetical protein